MELWRNGTNQHEDYAQSVATLTMLPMFLIGTVCLVSDRTQPAPRATPVSSTTGKDLVDSDPGFAESFISTGYTFPDLDTNRS